MLGAFSIKAFSTKDDLWTYIGDEQYGLDQHPAICFGFRVFENSKRDYELELFFNDLWPSYYRSVPSQADPATEAAIQAPDIKSYGYYTNEGYSIMQNWAANAILKEATKNADA